MKRPRTIPVLLGLIKKIEQDPQSKETEENSLLFVQRKSKEETQKAKRRDCVLAGSGTKRGGTRSSCLWI